MNYFTEDVIERLRAHIKSIVQRSKPLYEGAVPKELMAPQLHQFMDEYVEQVMDKFISGGPDATEQQMMEVKGRFRELIHQLLDEQLRE